MSRIERDEDPPSATASLDVGLAVLSGQGEPLSVN
jgi:hypothetical protein